MSLGYDDLYPYQKTGCDIMKNRSYCLFFPMGVGKTCTSIVASQSKPEVRLVVCNKTALLNWKEEIETWDEIKEGDILILGDNYGGVKKACLSQARPKWIVTNHHTLLNKAFMGYWMENPPSTFIADEAQRFTNIDAKWSKAYRKFSYVVRKNGGHVYVLTGTPAKNTKAELYNLIRSVQTPGIPNFDPNYDSFKRNFFAEIPTNNKHYTILKLRGSKTKEFNEIVAANSISVDKQEALPYLPPLIQKVHTVPMSKDQIRMYKDLKSQLRSEYKGKVIRAFEARSLLVRFRQIASGVVPITEEIFPNTPKAEYFMELIEQVDKTAIIWANFNPAVDYILQLLKGRGTAVIRGGQKQNERQSQINSFCNDDEIRFMVANPQAGGDSINLVEANHTIRWDQTLSFERTDQSEARNWRKGSEIHDFILSQSILCEDSVEIGIFESLKGKQKGNQSIINIAKTLIG